MAFAETLAPFFADFAVAATLPDTSVVLGIFDAAPKNVLGVAGSDPQFIGATAGLSGLVYGNVVEIGGVNWTVRGSAPDGTGLTTLTLEAA
jgi:hypothetical protein